VFIIMKYAYENLSPEQFEKLVVLLCQNLLGISVQGFANGPDGGRDAKFIGTAELFPSKTAQWVGKVIIQAKHTNGYNKSFSETDFHSKTSQSTVIEKEIPKIQKLRNSNELDHYMLFANRKLTGNAEHEIKEHISKTCNIPIGSVYLCGVEQLELWLKRFPDVVEMANIDSVDSPLLVSPDELAEIVEAFAKQKDALKTIIDTYPTPRTPYETKNTLNNMSKEYATIQKKQFLKDTFQIQLFLQTPENMRLMQLYETTVLELQLKIVAKRKDYQSFDDVMNYLADLLFARDPLLNRNKRLTRTMLFFMYWNCDIGVT